MARDQLNISLDAVEAQRIRHKAAAMRMPVSRLVTLAVAAFEEPADPRDEIAELSERLARLESLAQGAY